MKDESKVFVCLNGSLIPREDAKVSVFDRGFLYGDGVFETVRLYGGRPFKLKEHLERLAFGAETLRFKILPEDIGNDALKTIGANGVREGIMRIAVSRGEATTGIDPSAHKEPTVAITVREGIPYPENLYERGFRAIIPAIRKDSRSALCRIKSANFLTHILAKGEASDAGVDDAVMLNHEGFVAEATVSNIFIVKGSFIVTPSVESGILPGTTRKAIIDVAANMGLKVAECEVKAEMLYSADEAFLTNSLIEVMPLVEVDKRPVGDGLPGVISRELRKAYKERVMEQL